MSCIMWLSGLSPSCVACTPCLLLVAAALRVPRHCRTDALLPARARVVVVAAPAMIGVVVVVVPASKFCLGIARAFAFACLRVAALAAWVNPVARAATGGCLTVRALHARRV